MMNDSFCRIIAGEIQARPEQVDAAVRLLDEGNTVNSVEFPNAIHPSVGFIPKGGFLVHLF